MRFRRFGEGSTFTTYILQDYFSAKDKIVQQSLNDISEHASSSQDEKILVIALFAILGIGFIGILFVVFPWVFSHGFANWKQTLIDDGLIIVCLILFVFGFYMNTRMH